MSDKLVGPDKVVSIEYTLRDSAGTVLEKAEAGEPMEYLHGHFNIFFAVENTLEGKTVGDQVSVAVPAVEGYGLRKEGAVQRVPVKHLSGGKKKKLRPGDVVRFYADDKPVEGTVIKLGKFNADVDMNHPLAGIDLQFDIRVVDIRDARAEEIAHGHVHGHGGCSH